MLLAFGATSAPAPRGDCRRPGAARDQAYRFRKTEPVIEPRLDPTLELDLLSRARDINTRAMEETFLSPGRWRPSNDRSGTAQRSRIRRRRLHQPPPIPPPPPISSSFLVLPTGPGKPKKSSCRKAKTFSSRARATLSTAATAFCTSLPLPWKLEDVLNNNRQSLPLTQG